MPTRYWLVSPSLCARVGRLEADRGVKRAEAEVGPDALERLHRLHASERDAHVPDGWAGPRPFGGVGGTRRGVKCLHAHLAHWLAGGDDPVGQWVADRLGEATDPSEASDPGEAVNPEQSASTQGRTEAQMVVESRP